MTTRLLARDEFPRLVGTELETVWPHLPPDARVVVVEDDIGAIVGCWAVYTSVHCEGVWIAPWMRGKGAVARRLMGEMAAQLEDIGARAFVTGAVSNQVRAMIAKVGGTPLPGEQYVVLRERLICPQPQVSEPR